MNTVVEILLDISGSMGTMKGSQDENKYLLDDGSTRISLAKKILSQEIIPTIYYASKIIIRTFKSDKKDEEPVISLLYNGVYNKGLINQKLISLPNDTSVGGTPITAAIIAAVNNLKSREFSSAERLIILVTDGGETGEGNYKTAAENAMSIDGITCKIHIIGISLNDEAERKAIQLAETTHGIYLPLKASNYNSIEISKALTPLKISVVKESLQNILSHQNPSPATAAKIEAIGNKLEAVLKEKENYLFTEQLEILKSKNDETQLKIQTLISEFSTLLEKQQLSILISTIEKSISQKLADSIFDLKKAIENVSAKSVSLNEASAKKVENLNTLSSSLINKVDDLTNKKSIEFSSLNEILQKLNSLENVVKQISKRQRQNTYNNWVILALGLIAFITFWFLKTR